MAPSGGERPGLQDEEDQPGDEGRALLAALGGEVTNGVLGVTARQVLGGGVGDLRMSQLDALEEVHRSALEKLKAARWDLVRKQEREKAEEEASGVLASEEASGGI